MISKYSHILINGFNYEKSLKKKNGKRMNMKTKVKL